MLYEKNEFQNCKPSVTFSFNSSWNLCVRQPCAYVKLLITKRMCGQRYEFSILLNNWNSIPLPKFCLHLSTVLTCVFNWKIDKNVWRLCKEKIEHSNKDFQFILSGSNFFLNKWVPYLPHSFLHASFLPSISLFHFISYTSFHHSSHECYCIASTIRWIVFKCVIYFNLKLS